ncbi:pentatricopeptide repeat-containing protein At1g79540-like [Silene latifolia]|uniref:pentatricopeptide repeat-containing protein At1g79540-like n=1 Tax=Silene latifolia TaxID=37657 RepID=UPI003D7865B4
MTHPLRRLTTIFKPFTSQTFKPDPLTHITSILTNHPQPEPELDRITSLLTPKTVSSVLTNPPTLKSGFRFFLWATRYRSLKAWNFVNLIHNILLVKNNDGFTVFWDTLVEMRKCGVVIPSEAFLVLVSGYFKAGFGQKAVNSFGMMKDFDCKPNVFTFNAVLYGMVEEDVVLLALAVYNQMLKCNCVPNVATYSILIHGLCNIGKVEDALLLFDEMTERGILPNTVTYTIVLLGLCRAGRPFEAIDLLLNEMMSGKSCRPDRVTWDGLLAGFCKLGKVEEAFLLSNFFQTQGYVLGVKGHSCLIDGLFRVGRFEEANNWFHKVVEENVVAPDVVMYTIMIRGFCEVGRVKGACRLFLEMTDKGVVPDTQCYNVLIKGFCDAGLLEEARSLKLEISQTDCFPDTHTNTILICGMCRNGLVREARQIFEEMEKHGCLPSIVTFNALIDGFCKNGRLEEACLMFYKMEMEIGGNPSLCLRLSQGTDRVMDKASLQNLISGLCESGLSFKAYRLLTKLAENGIVPDIVTYNILINGMCRSRNMDGAFKIFRELQLMGESPDVVTYGTLINGLFTAHREEEAMGMVEDMINNGITPSSSIYRSLMTWSCRRRKVSMSFRLWMNYLRRVKNRDNNVIRLIEEHFEKGDVEETIRCLLKIDFKMKDFDLGPYTIWLIGFCQARRLDEALKIFYVLQEFGVSVPAPSCVRLIQACCVARELDRAADVFGYALEKGYMITQRKCSLILCSMFRSEPHVYNAISLVNKMDAMGFDLDAHLSLKTKALWQYHIAAMHNLPGIKHGVASRLAVA